MLSDHGAEQQHAHHKENHKEYDGNNENWHTSPLQSFWNGLTRQAVTAVTAHCEGRLRTSLVITFRKANVLEYDRDKVDEMVLALLWLTRTGDGRAWKGHDWDAMDRLHAKGYISDPKSKAKSVILTEEGERLAGELFQRYFGRAGS